MQNKSDCLFCRIISGEIPTKKYYESEQVLAFADIHPKAPVHLLVISKEHLTNLNDLSDHHEELMSDLLLTITRLAKENNIDQTGYRVVININHHGGQEISHLHLHLLGGKKLGAMC